MRQSQRGRKRKGERKGRKVRRRMHVGRFDLDSSEASFAIRHTWGPAEAAEEEVGGGRRRGGGGKGGGEGRIEFMFKMIHGSSPLSRTTAPRVPILQS